MKHEEIKKYWNARAKNDSSAQSTTNDIYLREIECQVLSHQVKKHAPKKVADIGCGDGRTTALLAEHHSDKLFSGFDYSSAMVENAIKVNASESLKNLIFDRLDIIKGLPEIFDFIYTTRCLINIPSWKSQQIAIENIHGALSAGGVFVLIENFIEGHENFNKIRRDFDLPEISIREHNFYFEKERLLKFLENYFRIEEEKNISSTYYLVSRVVYSKICNKKGEKPDYFDEHHRLAALLPFSGEFGPVRMLCLKKR